LPNLATLPFSANGHGLHPCHGPADLPAGNDIKILANRHQIYQEARLKHPERWSEKTRNWETDAEVVLKKFKRLRHLA
jgi:hypothetical protein